MEKVIVMGGSFDPPHNAHMWLPNLLANKIDAKTICTCLQAIHLINNAKQILIIA